ncbi:hypothetical protein SARC_04761 [Sphaeroforma arctica JP610]|uniref:Uncharacterized protein n=1 Tax=Sphaeroforma arctica JP610 TaxID=667725 RepID=A0A0L0G407_9EUKA|nr:hypothetical protein SARC_04761 [Sphaeroforma arctica JP610]KNC82968.1 hypothetical protein SARC_04761 [Sphaeroforma arctica JP610]|eukprot:XP_014156870.1 hypothetical protein SARC_04761 [Sphaeroforma arctica JP610]
MTATRTSVICCPDTNVDHVKAAKPALHALKPSETHVVALQTCPKETGLGMADKLSSDMIAVQEASIRTRFWFGRCSGGGSRLFKFAGLVKSIFGFEYGWTIFPTFVARSDYYNENVDKVEKVVAFIIQ